MDESIAKSPKEAALGGIPGIENKVRAYVDTQYRDEAKKTLEVNSFSAAQTPWLIEDCRRYTPLGTGILPFAEWPLGCSTPTFDRSSRRSQTRRPDPSRRIQVVPHLSGTACTENSARSAA